MATLRVVTEENQIVDIPLFSYKEISSISGTINNVDTITDNNMDYMKKKFVDKEDKFISFFSTDDNVLCENGEDLRTNLEKLKNRVDIKDFGAKGDGITDDTVSIKKAILYAQNNNINKVYFTNGTYKVSETIDIPNDVSIYVEGLCKIKSSITDGSILNFTVENESDIKNIHLVFGEGKLYINSLSGRNTQYVVGIKINGNGYSNINISNVTVNNCYVGLQIESRNVWNVTINDSIFFYNTYGYFYGQDISHTSATKNSGERICFKNCVFTQNICDNAYFGLTWSQTNYHNCSFDMSDCVFYIPRNDVLGWDAGTLKISCSQCHFEGIGINITDVFNYQGKKGIFYVDGEPYATILSIEDSTFAITAKYPLFYSKNQANISNLIILRNIFTIPSTDIPIEYPFLSKNCNVVYSDMTYRGETSTIDGFSNLLMRTMPPSIDCILNSNPFFQNLTENTYTITKNSIIGDFTVEESTAVNSINISDNNNYVNNGRKITINFDTNYSEQWNSTFSLINNEKIRVHGGDIIIAQPLITSLSRGDESTINRLVNVNIIEYDEDKNKITNSYLRMISKTNSEKTELLLGIPIKLQPQTKFISYNLSITNGLKDNIYPTRELEGMFIYKL